jgi:hypothetical protein
LPEGRRRGSATKGFAREARVGAGMNCAFRHSMMTLLMVLVLTPPAGLVVWLLMRDWLLEWGSSDREVLAAMAGDELVTAPTHQSTFAVTVNAEPADVWPWLVQMGFHRGGLYSYDWLDRLFGYLDAPSADRILPEFQHVKPGDRIPLGRGPAFPVAQVDPFRLLVLGDASGELAWTWQFEVHQYGRHRTRLISRSRVHMPRTVGSGLFMALLEPAAFIMTRKMLLGIKRRAESLARQRQHSMPDAA